MKNILLSEKEIKILNYIKELLLEDQEKLICNFLFCRDEIETLRQLDLDSRVNEKS